MKQDFDYVLVGGGVASVWAAQNIREADAEGSIVLIGKEPHPPYDRPPFSKNFLTNDAMTPDDGYSKYDDFYPKNRISLHTATQVTRIDRADHAIHLADGSAIGYGKLLLATGSRPLPLNIPGAGRPGVFLLRTIEDAVQIRDAMRTSQRAVVIGAGFLGMEVASSAMQRGLDVTLVEQQAQPWPRFASPKLGGFLQRYYEQQGALFFFGAEAVAFDGSGEGGPVTSVRLQDGTALPTDLVVVSVGVALNSELASQAGLQIAPDGGVQVDEFLQTSDPRISAAGDVACFNDIAIERKWHAEHHLNAKWQGQAVGKIMAGARTPYDRIPYFFSDFLDLHMVLRGDPQGGGSTIVLGDIENGEFTELYCRQDGSLCMVVAVSHDEPKLEALSDTLERLIRAKVNLSGRESELHAPGFDLNNLA